MSQVGLELVENGLVSGLGFPICLRMSDGGESMLDVQLVQEFLEPSIVKLSTITHNNHPWETIPAYYGFSNKGFGLGFGDVGHGLGLYPFSEVIHCYEEEFLL